VLTVKKSFTNEVVQIYFLFLFTLVFQATVNCCRKPDCFIKDCRKPDCFLKELVREDHKLSKLKLLCCTSDDLMDIAHVFARQDGMSLSQLLVEVSFMVYMLRKKE
jgi:hypothetical protein